MSTPAHLATAPWRGAHAPSCELRGKEGSMTSLARSPAGVRRWIAAGAGAGIVGAFVVFYFASCSNQSASPPAALEQGLSFPTVPNLTERTAHQLERLTPTQA